MTSLNREEIIVAISRAISQSMNIDYNDNEDVAFWGKDIKPLAEAALDALIALLPTGYTLEEETCGKTLKGEDVIIDSVIYDDRAEIYKQLLSLKRE